MDEEGIHTFQRTGRFSTWIQELKMCMMGAGSDVSEFIIQAFRTAENRYLIRVSNASDPNGHAEPITHSVYIRELDMWVASTLSRIIPTRPKELAYRDASNSTNQETLDSAATTPSNKVRIISKVL